MDNATNDQCEPLTEPEIVALLDLLAWDGEQAFPYRVTFVDPDPLRSTVPLALVRCCSVSIT